MKSIFEEMGGTYRQVGDYFIPNITLKAEVQIEWVRRMNSIRNRAEEIILTELVYA